MTHKLTTPKILWILCRKSWIMIFAILLFTTNLTFSNDSNTYPNESKTTFSLASDEAAITTTSVQVSDLITKDLWNTLFPYRFGAKDTGGGVWVLDPSDDFYTFESFIDAINRMGKIKAIFERRCGTNAYRVTRVNKTTGESKIIRTDADFDAPRNINKEIVIKEVDYATFLEEGDLETRKREITAFFANISHETTGGWPTAPGGQFSWGLHFREEPTNSSYASADPNYPPTPGKSYKGRGPMQLSYNYNYGPASEFIFGDKQILLDNPEKVIEDAALAFQTAIWFWMTPQYPKPSAHDVMVENWTPRNLDLNKNRIPGLGMTVNIINGGVECGQGSEKPQVQDRIGYYERFTNIYNIGTDMDSVHDLSDCGCKDMTPYGGDATDLTSEPCALKPEVSFLSPSNNQVIKQTTFSAVQISLEIDQKDTQLSTVTTTIEGQNFSGTSFNWTPSGYGSHTLTANATFQNGATDTSTIKVVIWDGGALNCQLVQEWSASVIYRDKDNYIKYNNKVYRNRWYADSSNIPGSAEVWEFVADCNTSTNIAPTTNITAPANNSNFTEGATIAITANAADSDGTVTKVEFYNGTTKLGEDTNSPYEYSWQNVSAGNYSITAKATDNDNAITTSSAVSVSVIGEDPNTPPTVSITSPNINDAFTEGASITISANAADSDGSISKVEFYNGSTKLGEDTSSPYSYVISNASVGDYSLTAKAIDNESATTTSSVVSITVNSDTGGSCNGLSQYAAGASYSLNEEVQNEGEKFKCNIPGWCSSPAAWAYAPGTGLHWQSAWSKTGDCSGGSAKIASNGYSIFPTITTGIVNLRLNTNSASWVRVSLYDLSGKLIRKQSFNKIKAKTTAFTHDLSDLKNGLYVFQIYIDDNVYFEKILKK